MGSNLLRGATPCQRHTRRHGGWCSDTEVLVLLKDAGTLRLRFVVGVEQLAFDQSPFGLVPRLAVGTV